ncbi:MAG: class I adenylate-forming enzyme family protein [Planctomycetota bacterium]
MNIVTRIMEENAERLGSVSIVDGGITWTYEDLFENVREIRRELESKGIRPGQRVAFRCADGTGYIVGSLALLAAGAAVVPVSMELTDAEREETLERIDVHAYLFQKGADQVGEGGQSIESSGLEKSFVLNRRPGAEPGPEEVSHLDMAFIRFSSGTTGMSKGVVLSHRSILDRTDVANEALRIRPDDRILWVLLLSHHFVVSILLYLRKGATIVMGHRNFPASVIEAVQSGDITFIYASPVHYELFARTDAVDPPMLDDVRIAISTAMKLPEHIASDFADKFGIEPAEAYGIIEVGLPFINTNPSPDNRGSVGQKLDAYELRIEDRDENGVGELLVRGPGMFDAYYSPWRWRENVLEDGWFRTGDLGRMDEKGDLYIAGRSKTVIICGGMKVFPVEVEEVLDAHPAISESLVYGRDHATYGQIPVAKIVAEGADDDAGALDRELREYCYDRLSAHKVPKEFQRVDELPRTTSGKLRRADGS